MEDKKFDGTDTKGASSKSKEKIYTEQYVKGLMTERDNLRKKLEETQDTKEEVNKDDLLKVIEDLKGRIDSIENAKSENKSEVVLADSIAAAITKNQNERDGRPTLFTVKDIDNEDYLKEGVVFVCHSSMHLVHTDTRRGVPVVVPYGKPVIFKDTERTIYKDGQYQNVNYRCFAKVHSKKVLEYLEDHTEYGIKFFKLSESKDYTTEDKMKMDYLIKANTMVNSADSVKIAGLCSQYGVPLSEHPDVIRTLLKHKIADEGYNAELNKKKKIIAATEDSKRFIAE